ncbi:bifunctional adenosylcobinamide kinase/adenosylcobinamide-phosphate guanylyltransferase [Corynebacterium sp. ES2794-CONJ1]|uniref:bifunctional adenosylcobinamide kinase/adenosylcobinamide-phosphate guanylyltransferase n=1 Tax=unclassified Corynebacterium TaxID=2624378 RepID=UPI002168B907|nr:MULTISPECIES: bifunctional adenosylcobinamide kinase/adenosylcobinamide-phosphate guanylyltransferase [unclassified Corynebacterium]MCS4488980.1 bifunctional adenosylcobinamide kinase/adenosylcobinamide-phosphate guanylyltransferase [Corynebacterium sp. ES2775-CONJ]MCS4490793.1 bifunctional adenosylcobinamide kinase/adenosylcobinamide-phosphate guanylyltransferase [Corynebacterium sp. ES2715-CONJ3]MCS4531324.1 bifunctional adenosylcobinamide kinase/adenosylcobinamide-phosphate guanylyltransfe
MRTLIVGGARSGKSAFAEGLAGSGPCLYIATARGADGDEDFRARIYEHQRRRPLTWITEDRADIRSVLASPEDWIKPHTPILIDDLGTWLSALIDAKEAWESPRGCVDAEIEELCALIDDLPDYYPLVIVSPEVGMGIIPHFHSGRLFRDELGRLNQLVADICEEVVFVVAGQALPLKKQLTDKDPRKA